MTPPPEWFTVVVLADTARDALRAAQRDQLVENIEGKTSVRVWVDTAVPLPIAESLATIAALTASLTARRRHPHFADPDADQVGAIPVAEPFTGPPVAWLLFGTTHP
jgi:hypothetical protein